MHRVWANELLYEICCHLQHDQPTLAQLVLTSRQWRLIALPFLYHSPHWTHLSQVTQFAHQLTPETGELVRQINLHMVPHRWMSLQLTLDLSRLILSTPSVEWLNLNYCPLLTNEALLNMMQHLPDLRILSLENCSRISDRALEKLADYCPYLQEVYLGYTQLTDDSLMTLTQMTLLHHISLRGCQHVTERGIQALLKLKTLTSLDIQDCYNVVTDSQLPLEEEDLWTDDDDDD